MSAAADDAPHIPVLIRPLIAAVSPVSGVWLDGTFGNGGYTRALLEAGADQVIGVDRDPMVFKMAAEWAEYGIRVNAVSPGTIDTPFHQQIKSTKPEVFASWKNNIMLGRLGRPDDVAGVVAFLASADAAFITAETIQIGGGQALGI